MSKHHNIPTVKDNVTFHSKREAERYEELKLLQHAGKISGLVLQPVFPIHVNDIFICRYYADFSYLDMASREDVIEDVKSPGTRTIATYRLKKKLVQAIYGIAIVEVM